MVYADLYSRIEFNLTTTFPCLHKSLLTEKCTSLIREINNKGYEEPIYIVIMDPACVYVNREEQTTFAIIIHVQETLASLKASSLKC